MNIDTGFGKKIEKTPADYERMNDYQRLGVLTNASAEEIKKAYRKRMLEFHPGSVHNQTSKVPEKDLNLIAQYMQEAYDRLSSGPSVPTLEQAGVTDTYEELERVKEAAAEKAREGASFYVAYIKDLDQKNVTGSRSDGKLFRWEEVNHHAIYEGARKKMGESIDSYLLYMKEWADLGWSDKFLVQDEELNELACSEGIKKVSEGAASFGEYFKKLKEAGLASAFNRVEGSKDLFIKTVMEIAEAEKAKGPEAHQAYMDSWKPMGVFVE